MRFKRKDNFLRHVRRQHPMTHVVTTDTENINSAKDIENTVENSKSLQETNQSGGGFTTNETIDCVTEEEAINGNLKVYNLPALDKTKFDSLQFLSSNYEKVKKILRTVLLKIQSVKWYLTMQVRFKKEKKDRKRWDPTSMDIVMLPLK